MLKSKEQVDVHVQNLFKRCRSEIERNLRGYHVAKLYKQVGDFESAHRYIVRYIASKENSAEAHKLFGQILLGLKQKSKALAEFKASLQLDHHQNDVLLKVCDILADLDEPLDPDAAQYWVDRTRTHFPNHPAVFRLRERIVSENRVIGENSSSKDTEALEALLKAELNIRPNDVQLRIRLLQLYLRSDRVKDAYRHALHVEGSRDYSNDIRWYNCLADVFEAYKENVDDWDYVAGKINVLERLAALSLEEYPTVDCGVVRSNVDCAKSINSFDQALHSASLLDVVSSDREYFHEFLKHMRGQLVLHLATLIFRKAKKDTASWRDASKAAAALLLHAVGFGGNSPPDPQPPWAMRLHETHRAAVARWAVETSFRVSQAGHILLGLSRDRGSHLLDQLGNFCTGNWRERVYQKALGTQYDKEMEASSHFLNFQSFAHPVLEIPSLSDLQPHDAMAQKLHPESLHHFVWLGLESGYSSAGRSNQPFQIPAEFCCLAFDGLSLCGNSLKAAGPESISQMDVDAFLYATIYCSASKKEEWEGTISLPADQGPPPCLPVALTEPLCSPAQSHWWSTTHQLLAGHPLPKGDKSDSLVDVGERRMTMLKGLQVVRTQGNHGLGPELCVKLARMFMKRAKILSASSTASSNEVHALEERANLYWSVALPLLERMSRNQVIQYPQNRLFNFQGKTLNNSEVSLLLDEANLAMAIKVMSNGKLEEAIASFQQLKVPEASYYQGLAYKKLAAQEVNGHHREDITPEMKSHQVALLTKAKECFHLTEERLRMIGAEKTHPIAMGLASEMEDLDILMDRLDVVSWSDNEKPHAPSAVVEDSGGRKTSVGRAWNNLADRSLWPGTRNGTPIIENVGSPLSTRGMANRWTHSSPLTASFRTPADSEKRVEHNPNRVEFTENISAALDLLPKLMEELASLKLSVTEAVIDIKSGVEDLRGVVRSELDDVRKKTDGTQSGLMDLKELLDSLKGDISKLKASRYRHHSHSEGARQEGRDAEEDIYVYGGDEDYGDNDVNIAAAAAAAAAAQAQSDKYGPYAGGGYPYQGYPTYRPISGAAGVSYAGGASQAAASTLLTPSIAPFFQLAATPMDPSLLPANAAAGMYHSPLRYYGQGALPFSEGQQLPDFRADTHALSGAPLRPPLLPPTIGAAHSDGDRGMPPFHSIGNEAVYAMDKSMPAGPSPVLPVNVVITSSDTLPTAAPPSQQQLGVVIPPRHRLGVAAPPSQPVKPPMSIGTTTTSAASPSVTVSTPTTAPHAFQISMPPQAQIPTSSPLDKTTSSVPPVKTDKLLSEVPSPVHSAVAIDRTTPKSSKSKALDGSAGKNRSSRTSIGEEDDDEEGDSVDPYPDFQPSIPLPALVETHTGEEEETLLFSSRAKLYRFVEKEWKERGVGIIKILHNEETGKSRIIMRREQVLKVCANHFLTPDMTLSPIASSKGLAWLWCANDFADEEVRLEKLSARFKTTEDAEAFREAFEKAKSISATPEKSSSKDSKQANEKASATTPLRGSEKLQDSTPVSRKTVSSPNTPKAVSLPEAQKPVITSHTPKASESSKTEAGNKVVVGGFTFVSPPTLKPVEGEENKSGSNKKKADDKKTSSKTSIFADFTFGQSAVTSSWGKPTFQLATSAGATDTSTNEPKTGLAVESTPFKEKSFFEKSPSNQPSFSALAAKSEEKVSSTTKSDAKTSKGSEGTGSMFTSPPKDGRRVSESEEGDFMPTVEFEPVIPLPQLVEVKTGEEGEDVLFERRAKLLRHGNKEWIEFGIGQMKVTLNPMTGKVRLIMRREQVLKVCCNHFLTEDMQFMPLKKSDRCWTWCAQDYSDGNLTPKTLAIKFKTAEEAMEFKKVLDDLQKGMVDGKAKVDGATVSTKEKSEKKSKDGTTEGKVDKQTLSDMFKPEAGSWECKECYIRNKGDTKSCVACNTLRPGFVDNSPKDSKEKSSFSPFKFGIDPQVTSSPLQIPTPAMIKTDSPFPPSGGFKFGLPNTQGDSQKTPVFGSLSETPKSTQPKKTEGLFSLSNAFKPEEGSWECKNCYIRNNKDTSECVACQSWKPGAVSSTATAQPTTIQSSFTFGIPTSSTVEGKKLSGFSSSAEAAAKTELTKPKEASGFLAAFKPEEGSWECSSCYVRNKKDVSKCSACGNSKPGLVAVPQSTAVSSTMQAFRFGMPTDTSADTKPTSAAAATTSFTFGTSSVVSSVAKPTSGDTWPPTNFTFGGTQFNTSSSSTPSFAPTSFTFGASTPSTQPAEASIPFTFASEQKYEFHFKGVDPAISSSKGSLLKSPDRQTSHDESGGSDLYQEEDDEDHIHFQPVIPLPDKVPVHTGEEDESILYQHRARLYRWSGGEWKERGCGEIKLLKHKETGRVRMIMRREQVLKLCLNHYVTKDIKLLAKGDRAWQWTAVDFSEGEMQPELFSLKFKSSDIAQAFKEAFEKSLSEADGNVSVTTGDSTIKTPPRTSNTPQSAFSVNKSPAMQSFRFCLESGSDSDSSDTASPRFSLDGVFGKKGSEAGTPQSACTFEPEVVYELKVSEEDRRAALKLMLPPNFYNYRNMPPCPGCRGCEEEDGTPKIIRTVSKVSEVIPKESKNKEIKVAESSGNKKEEQNYGLPFLNVDSGLSFATLAATDTKPDFSSAKPTSVAWSKAPVFSSGRVENSHRNDGDSGGESEPETHDPHFEPVIPLPDLIDVRTGEEDEVEVFCQRAKLYRYDTDTKEWKERGVGDFKILFHPVNHTYRFLMRREVVLKLVCNHLITVDFELKPMKSSNKSYVWYASNYIEEKQSLEQLCARFKDTDVANKFALAVQECVSDLQAYQASKSLAGISDVSSVQQEEEEEEGDDDEYEEVDDEALEKKVIFDKRGKLELRQENEWKSIGVGDIKVLYEPEIASTLITLESSDGIIKFNALITNQSTIETKEKTCDCTAADITSASVVSRRFKIQFSSELAAADFDRAFKQGVSVSYDPQEDED